MSTRLCRRAGCTQRVEAGRRWCSKTCRARPECKAEPSPEEIASLAAEVRSGWTEPQRRQRAGDLATPWTVPIVRCELPAD